MLYQAYDTQTDLMSPLRMFTGAVVSSLPAVSSTLDGSALKKMSAAYQVFSLARLTHTRPSFGIGHVMSGTQKIAIQEEVALTTPFATLLHFRKEGGESQPPVLVVAPMSGHFATLLRETVRTILADHDVYITDWHNARDVPPEAGVFGIDAYAEHLIRFLGHIGPGAHMVAICQPCVAALAATAIMSEDGNPACPRSLTLMAGPIDTRVNPTDVNRLATSKPMEWFEHNLICRVPDRYPGGGRRVYPGFLQLMAFMSMNMDRHIKSFVDLYRYLVEGDDDKAQATRKFYDEYFAVLDLPADFYLETVRTIFQEYALPLGQLKFQGRSVNPAAIRKTALLTVEGERDDICAIGQTVAAHDLCSGIRPYLKTHYMQLGVGHYGVFSGRKWMTGIYPVIRDMIQVAR
jgi:poly(3-hydroxybutyrate) depolymerase